MITQAEIDYAIAVAGKKDTWVPACGGTEQIFTTRSGKRLQYCYNPNLGRHAYLDVDSDRILTNEEAFEYLGMQ